MNCGYNYSKKWLLIRNMAQWRLSDVHQAAIHKWCASKPPLVSQQETTRPRHRICRGLCPVEKLNDDMWLQKGTLLNGTDTPNQLLGISCDVPLISWYLSYPSVETNHRDPQGKSLIALSNCWLKEEHVSRPPGFIENLRSGIEFLWLCPGPEWLLAWIPIPHYRWCHYARVGHGALHCLSPCHRILDTNWQKRMDYDVC